MEKKTLSGLDRDPPIAGQSEIGDYPGVNRRNGPLTRRCRDYVRAITLDRRA